MAVGKSWNKRFCQTPSLSHHILLFEGRKSLLNFKIFNEAASPELFTSSSNRYSLTIDHDRVAQMETEHAHAPLSGFGSG